MANILLSEQEIQKLLDQDVLELIGGSDLPQEKKQELYLKMAETVQNRAIVRVYRELSEEEGKELDQLIDNGDTAKVQEYLRAKNLDLPAILAQEAVACKVEIYELFKIAQNTPKQE